MFKRIAIVSSSLPPMGSGGVSSAHYHLYRLLKKRGLTIKVFTFEDYNADANEEDVARFGTAPAIRGVINSLVWLYFRIREPGKIAYNLADTLVSALPSLKMNRAVKSFRPDIVIIPDHGCPGLYLSKPEHCRVVLISHHNPARFLGNTLWGLHSERDADLTVALENRVLKAVDLVVCPSRYMKEAFESTYRYEGPVAVIPNTVDQELIDSLPVNDIRGPLGLKEDAVVVYIPSAGSVFKGKRFVFEIIRRLAAQRSDTVGFFLSGEVGRELKHELEFVPSNARIFTPGRLNYCENLSIVKGCSFGVSPTLIESFGMAILEANFCGVPVVSFNTGGNRDIFSPDESGLLVPYLDLEALIDGGRRLMDSNYRALVSRKMSESLAPRFNGDAIIDRFLSLVQDVKGGENS